MQSTIKISIRIEDVYERAHPNYKQQVLIDRNIAVGVPTVVFRGCEIVVATTPTRVQLR